MEKRKKTGGRKAGTPNKITAAIREVFEGVFSQLQQSSSANLYAWAEANPGEFYKLASRLIPPPADASMGERMVVNVVTGVPKRADALTA